MEIKILKTDEISEEYWLTIVDGFNASFEGYNTTVERLKKAFASNYFGYSYHAICTTDKSKVIGFNTIAPNYYLNAKNKQKIKVGLSGSTYVLKEYRKEIFIFRDMYNALMDYCKEEGFIVFLGVPNMNSYRYTIKILKKKEVMTLPYYIFPKNAFNVFSNGKYSFLNFLSKTFVLLNLLLNYLFSYISNPKEKVAKYRILQNEAYLSKRFQNNKYKTHSLGKIKFSYVLYNEDNIKTIYLMYFAENGQKSLRALTKAIYYIYTHEKFDLIMYIGTMNLKQFLLLKAPKEFEPKKLPLTYSVLDVENKESYEDMGQKENWDFSLMNFDVR